MLYLCSRNPMNGAIPVPIPIMITGMSESDGKQNEFFKRAMIGTGSKEHWDDTSSNHPEQSPVLHTIK